jgi:integrase
MGLEIRRGRDGGLRRHWYASLVDSNGKRKVISLSEPLPVEHFPGSLRETGDTVFEASRARAQKELEAYQSEARVKGRADHLTERLIQAKTGRKVQYVKLADLPAKWRGLRRESKPGAAWLQWCDTVFARFAAAVPCEYLHEVTPEQAAAYVETLRGGFTRRTANGAASLLRSAFGRLLPLGTQNPFAVEIAGRGNDAAGETIHRRPLTAEELARLFEAARPDPFLYPLTVCAALTGLRIGDVCLLRWQSVDLRGGFVTVRTSKTGAVVEIPIFKPLREVLETALADRAESPYVWPDAARMYKKNRYGIVYRGKSLFARTFAETAGNGTETPAVASGRADLAEALPEASEAVRGAGFADSKRDRILDSLKRYASGQSYRQIEAETGRHRAQVSEDLREAERLTGLRLRRGAAVRGGRAVRDLIGATRAGRPGGAGKLSASVLGWHSLRGTWATLALSAGIPVETVKLVTGHATANTVLKFYHNPNREHLRAVLGDKLPGVLTGNGETPRQIGAGVADLARQIKDLSPADRARLAKLLKGGEQ